MAKNKHPDKPQVPSVDDPTEVHFPYEEEALQPGPEVDLDFIPDEELIDPPPYDPPPDGEGP